MAFAVLLAIGEELPDPFQVAGIVVRGQSKGQLVRRKWGVAVHPTLDALLRKNASDFVVVSVPPSVTPLLIQELSSRRVPVLAETPPAQDLDGMIVLHQLSERGARIQVAEQYPYQPLNAARLSIVESGVLGTVAEAQVSLAHTYHGMSLLRRLLGVAFQNVAITARSFISQILAGPNRYGDPLEVKTVPSKQVIAYLDFGDKLGIYISREINISRASDQDACWYGGIRARSKTMRLGI